jgi:hypothetical protein
MNGKDELPVRLDALDPLSRDPGYWGRFQDRVMHAAAPELARRRAMGEVPTITDIVLSWGRMLVPSALLAAVVSGILIAPRPAAEATASMAVEEVLQTLVSEPVPSLLASDEAPDPVFVRVALEGG